MKKLISGLVLITVILLVFALSNKPSKNFNKLLGKDVELNETEKVYLKDVSERKTLINITEIDTSVFDASYTNPIIIHLDWNKQLLLKDYVILPGDYSGKRLVWHNNLIRYNNKEYLNLSYIWGYVNGYIYYDNKFYIIDTLNVGSSKHAIFQCRTD